MTFERIELPHGAILCDPGLGLDCRELGDPVQLSSRAVATQVAGGRGAVTFLDLAGRQFVLRRYLRGGLPARVCRDRYLWLGEDRNRAFRELRLLSSLHDRGLPVPRPVAARYQRHGLSYSAELVTLRLPEVSSLGQRWLDELATDADWRAAGRCIRRFHDAGVQHADLNAHNIMLDGQGGAWLLDFDRGRIRRPGRWHERTLARLERSLAKLAALSGRGDAWRSCFRLLREAHDAGS
jgi:3-deoxy-D-manno-octulosonic acid kinase